MRFINGLASGIWAANVGIGLYTGQPLSRIFVCAVLSVGFAVLALRVVPHD